MRPYLCAGLALCAPALAAEDRPANRIAYPASYFAAYQPQNAYDMIGHLPGFALQEGDSARGFGGTAGNVLIDGRRPSSKAGIGDALSRIPAALVSEIVVTRGEAQSAEAQGQSVVANVIRKGGGRSGTWAFGGVLAPDGKVSPSGEIGYSLPIGAWETALKLEALTDHQPYKARRRTTDGGGTLVEQRRDRRPTTYDEVVGSLEATRTLGDGLFSLNARVEAWQYDLALDSQIVSGEAAGGDELYRLDEHGVELELGLDYTLPLSSGWTWKTIGLVTTDNYDGLQDSAERRPPDDVETARVDQSERAVEAIARTSLAQAGAVWRPEVSVEVAYNRLSSSFLGDFGGELERSRTLVQEWRGEAAANLGWTISSRWTLDAGLVAELSRIEARDAEQVLFYVKPSATLTFQASEKVQYRLSLARSVGQLDFSDFAASANIDTDQQFAGNPELRPDRTTRLAVASDWQFAERGALNVEIYHEWREGVLEYIRLPDGGEAIGNAGDAKVWGVTGSLDLPLDVIWPGLAAKTAVDLLHSRFKDPVTGRHRTLSDGDREFPGWTVTLRRDVPGGGLAYGVEYESAFNYGDTYLDKIETIRFEGSLGAFVETSVLDTMKLRLEVENLAGERYAVERISFAPDRAGALSEREVREARRGAFVGLTLSGRF